MDDAARLLLFGTLSAIGLTATFLVVNALFPRVARRTRRAAEGSPARSFWLGFVNVVFLSAVGLGLSAIADNSGADFLQLLALLVFSLLTILLTFGLTALAGMVGERLMGESSSLRQQIWGSVTMILGGLTPFVGWFLLFPYMGLLGVGAVILGWTRERRAAGDEPAAGKP